MEEDERLQEIEDFVTGAVNEVSLIDVVTLTDVAVPCKEWKTWCLVLLVGIVSFNFGVLLSLYSPSAYSVEPSFPTRSPTTSPTCMTPEPSVSQPSVSPTFSQPSVSPTFSQPSVSPTFPPTVLLQRRPQCIVVAGPESSGTHLIFNIVSFALGLSGSDDFTYNHGVVTEELGDINFKNGGHAIWHRSLPHGGGARTKITEPDPKLNPFTYRCCKRIFVDPSRMLDYAGDRCDFKVIFMVRDTTVIKRSQVYVQHTLNHETATQATDRALGIVNRTLMDSAIDSHLISYESMLALPFYTLNLLADFIGVPRSMINNVPIHGGNEKYCDGKMLDEELQKKVRGDANRARG